MNKITHILFDVSATLIYPFPNFDDFCIKFLEDKNIQIDKFAKDKANLQAEKVLSVHRKKVNDIPSNAVSERIVWSHYQSIRLKHLSLEDNDYPWLEWGYEIYDSYNPSDKWRLYEDVIPTLSKLKMLNYKLVVVSDFGPSLKEILKILNINNYFENIFISTIENASKSKGDLYNIVLKKLNIVKSKVLMIGDNYEVDVSIPTKLGITSIWLNRENKALPKNLPRNSKVITSLLEILNLLNNK